MATAWSLPRQCPLEQASRRVSRCQPGSLARPALVSGEQGLLWPGRCQVIAQALTTGNRTGGNVLDRPTISVPGIDKDKDVQKKKPRPYRVMLHNDTFNKREYVVQVLLKVVKCMTVGDAVNVMQEAHQNGLACVICCGQEEAEQYCEGLRNNGLISSIEPAGSGSGDGASPS